MWMKFCPFHFASLVHACNLGAGHTNLKNVFHNFRNSKTCLGQIEFEIEKHSNFFK